MPDGLIDLIEIDFRGFKFSSFKKDIFNELFMTREQCDSLVGLLSESKQDIDRLILLYGKPDLDDMEMMDVKREEVGYRLIKINPLFDDKTNLLRDWTYKLAYLTKREDGNPGMAFGDRNYTRNDLKS
ncbi:hypothetical protein J4408_03870 [Candidatus Pacearchaeota archaeon]|nr:hypothetical protein [Candidatus Pacearchaeota archaeon]